MSASASPAERRELSRLIDWARDRSADQDGPAFCAAVMRDDAVLASAPNRVEATGDPTRHAEICAMAEAGARIGPDLSGCVLVSTFEPCEMCLASAVWAGITRIVFAATRETNDAFFRFPGLTTSTLAAAAGVEVTLIGGVMAPEAQPIYAP